MPLDQEAFMLKYDWEISSALRLTHENIEIGGVLWNRPAIRAGLDTSLQRRGPGIIAMCYKDEIDIVTWYAWGHIRLDAPGQQPNDITEAIIDRWNWALFNIAEIEPYECMSNGVSVRLIHSAYVDLYGFTQGIILKYNKNIQKH